METTGMLRPGHGPYARATVALFLLGIATFSQLYTVQPLLVTIGADFHKGAAETSWLMSGATAGVAAAVLPLGHWAGRWGRKRTMMAGLAMATIIGVTLSFLTSWPAFIALRIIQGASLATVLVSAMAWVIAQAHPLVVTRLGGLYIAGTTVGGMTGRLVAGWVGEWGTWRSGVLAATLTAALAGGLAHLLLPGAEVYERDDSHHHGPDPNRRFRLGTYAIGGLGMAVFVGVFNVIGYRLAAPPFNVGTAVISTLFLTYLAGTATAAIAGPVAARLGLRTTLTTGMVIAGIGVALTTVAHLLAVLSGLLLLCAGFFLAHGLAAALAAKYAPRPAAASARYSLSYYAGSSLGGVVLAHAWDAARWSGTASVALIMVAIAALVPLLAGPPSGAPGGD
ncbi:MAG: MFS transporter [Bowdeniella nasicola]|nr:MFS transporter [Bowdeniella nasicola]